MKAGDFHERMASVNVDGKWGYIDTDGREVVPCQYTDARDFHEGLALVTRRYVEKCFIDKDGREVI